MKNVILAISLTALVASASINYCFVTGTMQIAFAGAPASHDDYLPMLEASLTKKKK
jgi:hypothetical protein